MKRRNRLKAWLIFGIYLAATLALVFRYYSIQKPAVERQEFPVSITYSYQGKTKTISDVYVAEYVRTAKYMKDDPTAWYGYMKDEDILVGGFSHIEEDDGEAFCINLNIEPGFLMGDPRYADSVCQPSAVYHDSENTNEDPAKLEQIGFTIVSWQYPEPIENTFSFGGICLSSEATILTASIAVAVLLVCVAVINKERKSAYGGINKVSIALNFLIMLIVFPFVLITATLSEILGDESILQQLLYLAPALTAVGVAASVTSRRMGHKYISFFVQFAGPVAFALVLVCDLL